MVGDTPKVTINDYQEVVYGLSIDTKIDDLEWPRTAVRSNFLGTSRYFADFGANNG